MSENKNPEDKDPSVPVDQKKKVSEEAVRGKKAIEAGHVASGENPESAEVNNKEKKDAANWHKEG